MEKKKNKQLKSTIFTLGLGITSFSMSIFFLASCLNNQIKDYKSKKEIMACAENINADLSLVNQEDGDYLRLLFLKDTPVYVKISEDINNREEVLIKKTINYYNKVFKTINDNYKFEIVDNSYECRENDIVIYFKNKNNMENFNGFNVYDIKDDLNKGNFIIGSDILIDWNDLKDRDDLAISYVLNHEFAHSLGLSDVYIEDTLKFTSSNTLMNSYNINVVDILYPSDYTVLQALYSNKRDYQSIISEIGDYREYFYSYYSNAIKNKYNQIKSLENGYLLDTTLMWKNYKIDIKNDSCKLTIFDDENNILDTSEGILYWSNGMFFIEGLEVNSISYIKNVEETHPYKFNLNIYKDDENRILVSDNLGEGTSIVNVKKNIKNKILS